MADATMIARAKGVYETLCNALDARGWSYAREEADMVVHFGVNGDDVPMKFILVVDVENQLIRLLSPLPFKMSEDKRMEGAIATCAASHGMIDGSFDYDLRDGQIVFRMTASFRESTVGEGLFQYMLSCACAMVDQYNEQLLALDKGLISLADFIAQG